jgi:ribonuclease P protein component
VYKSGQRFNDKLFHITACSNTLGFARLGLSIAARVVGAAVVRNRIRRVAREVFRLAQRELPALDLVLSARSPARDASRGELRADLSQLLKTVRERCASSSRPSSMPIEG